jgi:coproporphyrinogen III oxidase
MITKEEIQDWFLQLQSTICRKLEETDGQGKFKHDAWQRSGGGGGISGILNDGSVIEKGGVNFSAVWGETPDAVMKSLGLEPMKSADFFATGVSIVLHPVNPMVPIIHMNIRYFELSGKHETWWFGGGIDLTPHYVFPEDASYFHRCLRDVCDHHHSSYYTEFKKWADEYFYIKHRQETRGVGGIFFDYLKGENGFTRESRFDFVKSVGLAFAPLYSHLVKKNNTLPYGQNEQRWQSIRRGRYVEFNLVWDRGTRFGLDTDGRTESILMSLPPNAKWLYNHTPAKGSPEEKTQSYLTKDIDWIAL